VWGIINAQGDPWTSDIFHSEKQAQMVLNEKHKHPLDLSKHRVVHVSVTIRVIKPRK
jgi:hypothetical protein